MLRPVPDRAPAVFRAGDLGVSAEWRDISYDWSPLLTPDGVYIYSYLRDTYDQQRSLYPFLLIPEGPTKKKIQTRLGLKSAYAMHGPEFLLMTVGLLHVDVVYGQGTDPERPHHTHVAYYVVGRLDHPVLDWPMLERVLDALMIALGPTASEKAELSHQKKAEAALRSLGQAGLLQDCDPKDLFYELGAWPTLLPTLVGDPRWATLFAHLHGTSAMQRYRHQARMWAEYAQRYVARLEQDNQAIRDQVLSAQRSGPRRSDTAVTGSFVEQSEPAAVTRPLSQIRVTTPVEVTSTGVVTSESPASHLPAQVTSTGSVTTGASCRPAAEGAGVAMNQAESLAGDQLTHDRCCRGAISSTDLLVTLAENSDTHTDTSSDNLPLIEPHLRDAELGSTRFDGYFWCTVNDILYGSAERYDFSPGEKQAVFRQFKRQHVAVGVVLAALRASVTRLAPEQRRTLADVLRQPLFHACLQRALALLPARIAAPDDAHSWPAFLAAYRRVGFGSGLREVSVPDYNVLHGLFIKQATDCWDILSRIEHMAEVPDLSPRYLQRAIVNNQRAATESALAGVVQPAACRPGALDASPAARSRSATPGQSARHDQRRALLEREGLKPQLLTSEMTEAFIQSWIAEADARQDQIKSRQRWLVWGLTSGALPQDHPTLPPRAPEQPRLGRQSGFHVAPAQPTPSFERLPGFAPQPEQVWQIVCARLQGHVTDDLCRQWLVGSTLHAIAPAPGDPRLMVAYLGVAQGGTDGGLTDQLWPTVQRRYGSVIEQALGEVCGYPMRVEYADRLERRPNSVEHGGQGPATAVGSLVHQRRPLWPAVLADLQQRLAPGEFETWLKETCLVDLEDDQAIVGTSNIFVREKIEHSYAALIGDALMAVVGRPVAVQVVIEAAASGAASGAARRH